MLKSKKSLVTLFFTMLYISSCTFGGGFVIVTFIKNKFVDEYKWIDYDEMLDLTAISQSSPGAIAVNIAILVGWKVNKFIGIAVAVFATIIPPMVILTIVSVFYNFFATNIYVGYMLKGMQAGVVAIIIDVAIQLLSETFKNYKLLKVIIFISVFFSSIYLKLNIIIIILSVILVGTVFAVIKRKGIV